MNKPIPEKLYFRIGEVSKICGIKPYILRYWESQFSEINPSKTRSRHRLYRRKDVELILEIKKLLYEEKYTITGAKKRLKGPANNDQVTAKPSVKEDKYSQVLLMIKKNLEGIEELLK
jgi:DNA-binding transcriptional MerR regulator